ncbi:hypothetical protein [Paenibacillus sp. N3.4]|uniref:hypothetical protein n=1 Tax=Paenibacillus sp. N3.4 TaxID=2603222 RepID=UPI001C9CE536|nr:hypothetical protein [Paenibacillus sp. N3.4]
MKLVYRKKIKQSLHMYNNCIKLFGHSVVLVFSLQMKKEKGKIASKRILPFMNDCRSV